MSRRSERPDQIASLFRGRNQTLNQVAQSAADLKPFLRAWNNIVPKPACNFIHPAYFKDGRLTVWVHSPVWANWLRHRQGLIIDCIRATKLPEVHSLAVQLFPEKPSSAYSERKYPSPEISQTIEKSAQSITDPELRESLERLVKSLKNTSN